MPRAALIRPCAESHGIIFNCSKSGCLTFPKRTVIPSLTLSGQNVKSVNPYKYLRIVMDELSDDKYIQRQLQY